MVYVILKTLLKLVVRVYFRRVYLSGEVNNTVPRPTLLACNHPNSFMDAILLAVLWPWPINFLARSDVFNTPFKRWLLNQMHIIPIYRLEEGAANLHRNQETFAHCFEILSRNGTILIFSEGTSVIEKRLRPLRKGTARLALSAEEHFNFNLNLQLVPVTLNYNSATQFRQEVMIGFAPALSLQVYQPVYRTHPAKAIKVLTQQLASSLHLYLIEVEQPMLEAITERMLSLVQNNLAHEPHGWCVRSAERLLLEKQTASAVQHLAQDAAHFMTWQEQVKSYYTALQNSAVPDQAVAQPGGKLKKMGILCLGWPVFMLGAGLNIAPLWLARYITRRKVKKVEFYSSVKVVLGMVLYVIYYILLVIIGFSLNSMVGLFVAAGLPLTGSAALYYYDVRRKLTFSSSLSKTALSRLSEQRNAILAILKRYQ